MRYIIKTETTIDIDLDGFARIVGRESSIEQVQTEIKEISIGLTESQKKYNYISLGRRSPIQLGKDMPVTVIHEASKTTVSVRTHKTQLNRIDRMKPILDNYNVHDTIRFRWNSSESKLYAI